MRTELDTIAAYADDRLVAQGLLDWAASTDRRLQLPARRWRAVGRSGALLTRLYVQDAESGTQLVVIKVLPADQSAGAGAHHRALREAPRLFRAHLTEPLFDAVSLSDGRTLTFLIPASPTDDLRPLSDVAIGDRLAVLRIVTRALLSQWNPDPGVAARDVVTAIRDQLQAHPSALDGRLFGNAAGPTWIMLNRVVPNPARLLAPDSVFASERVDLAIGHIHGDLHGQNLFIDGRDGILRPGSFVMVDLTTYASDGQLGQDPVRLLLDAISSLLAQEELSEPQAQRILRLLVDPEEPSSHLVLPIAVALRDAVFRPAATLLQRRGTWANQYLLSLMAEGMAMATFESLGPRWRWWSFQLAANAARQLLVRLGRGDEIPRDAYRMENPFEHAAPVLDLTRRLPMMSHQRRRRLPSHNA